jgi:chromosome segregation ATPase
MKRKAISQKTEIQSRVKSVNGGIKSSEVSQNVKGILCSTLGDSIGVFKADRHPFNERLVAMVGEVLKAEQARLTQDVADKDKQFEELSPARTAREAAVQSTKDDATEKRTALDAAKAAVSNTHAPLKEAAGTLKAAEKAQKAGDAEADKFAIQKSALESLVNTCLAALVAGTDDGNVAKNAKAVLEGGKKEGMDGSLLSTAEQVLEKPVAERGSFDAVCLERLQAAFATAIASVDDKLAAEAPGKAERAAAVEQAQSAKQALETQQAELQEKSLDAIAAMAAATAAQKAAEQSLENFMPELKTAGNALDKAKIELAAFTEGPLNAFGELQDLKEDDFKPAPEPEPVAEEAASGSPEKRARTSDEAAPQA